jgi:MerR family transcriptional regulator, light-induced transcriptional regulator
MVNGETGGVPRWGALLGVLQQGYVDALLRGAENEAERIVREAIDAGVPEPTIDGEVIAPAMRVIGDLWAQGAITVADEHLATHITTRVLALQREVFRVAHRRAQSTVLLMALEGEQHVLGLEMAASILGHADFRVVMLGADVPLAAIAPAVERHRPAVVGFTATMPGTGQRLQAAIAAVRAAAPTIGVIAGGAAPPASLASVAGVSVCRHVGDAVETTDALLHRARLN